jgi:TPP-dependent trihydroxycyclohexane-1,2-dione (THcHDO) dehydratase
MDVKTVRLTVAQALVRYLAAQFVTMPDGSRERLFGGVWAIFGHGNVAGLGEALQAAQMCCPPCAPTTSKAWRWPPRLTPRRIFAAA